MRMRVGVVAAILGCTRFYKVFGPSSRARRGCAMSYARLI